MSTISHDALIADRGLRAEAAKTAELIARRLADPEEVRLALAHSARISWGGASLFSGHAGSALVFLQAARVLPGEAKRWRDLAHGQLVAAARSTRDDPLVETGMAAGTAGLAMALADAAADDPRYEQALRGLDRQLGEQVLATPSRRGSDGMADRDYDLLIGAAGTLARLASADQRDVLVRRATARLVADLVWLCTPTEGEERPWLPAFPRGFVDLGLARGVPGPLAALALAGLAGHDDQGLRTAIRQVARYLLDVAVPGEGGPALPSEGALTRDGWCHGAPGVACALLHAATALGDRELRESAVSALEGVLRRLAARGTSLRRLAPSATLCHGVAGLLAICARFARDAGSGPARTMVAALTEEVLGHCHPDLPLGVQDLDQRGVKLDNPGLLRGAAGVALALWSACEPIPARWQRALLIG